MPLLVPPPAASEGELLGLPVEALVASLKQETSNWLKLHESNEEMKSMISDTLAGQQTSEGIRLDKDDVGELQKACDENVSVIQRKGAMIAKMKDVLVEKAGEHAIPAEVIQAETAMAEAQQHEASEGIAL